MVQGDGLQIRYSGVRIPPSPPISDADTADLSVIGRFSVFHLQALFHQLLCQFSLNRCDNQRPYQVYLFIPRRVLINSGRGLRTQFVKLNE